MLLSKEGSETGAFQKGKKKFTCKECGRVKLQKVWHSKPKPRDLRR